MQSSLLTCIVGASGRLENIVRQVNDSSFDKRAVDLALVGHLRSVLAEVAHASAEASAEEFQQARDDPAYRRYLENLARLDAVVDGWYSRLLTHRARLAQDDRCVNAAQRWAEAYHRTR